MRNRQLLYLQYRPHCFRKRKTAVCGNVLRHFVSRQLYRSLYATYQTCLSTPVFPSAPSLLFMGFSQCWSNKHRSFGSDCLAWSLCKTLLAGVGYTLRTVAVRKPTQCRWAIPGYTWTTSAMCVHPRCGRSPAFASTSWTAHVSMVVFCTLAQGTPRLTHCPPCDARM